MATALIRTIILYILIMLGLRLMGKRQIGELEPAELVLTMMISDLATVPMQDFGIPLLAGIIPILTLLAMSMLLSQLSLTSLRFRELVCGLPTILIDNGRICQEAMRKNRFTIDELMEELRSQGFCDLQAIQYAVLENSGQLSILPWPQEQPPSAKQLKLKPEPPRSLPMILINDGRTLSKNLKKCGKDAAWLQTQLSAHGFSSPSEVFLLTITPDEQLYFLPKESA